ncbi:hypothetical protein NXY11_02775 [Parabacteroides faecis]|uniref:hypothetical protein n=1 Tax=Parabacteroides faecis TaxID=1217282 RepID=UPI002164CF98|nr:hypothetical protein [Parabacteroides faecis]MCS2894222.1 hypothetical protein [Parabacteroides faecis]UVQ47189.1 hypothetical protein NXY11_02775 [Parabacteroides faecis]
MKKISLIILTSFLLVACGAYKYLDLGMLTTGMTVAEVENMMGPPNRVLAVNKKDGYVQEVLEYRTARDEVYALEFWDNYLTGYEYLYDNVTYIPPVAPPMIFPDYGRPIYIYPPDHHHPNRPNKPNRPGSNRPESNRPSRPETNRPQTKPSEVTRPSNSGTSNRTEQYRNPTNSESKTNDRSNTNGRNGGRR